MTQMELFPLSLIERAARHAQARAHDEMLRKVNDAHGGYVSETGQMYADHVIFTDGDTPTFTIVREFWPDMASQYMDEAHPTMYERVCERIDSSFAA